MKNFNDDIEKNFEIAENYPTKIYTAIAVIFFILAFAVVKFQNSDVEPSFHEEIIHSDSISYIDGENLIKLVDGNYPLAMPAKGTFVNGVAPMLMVEVRGRYYPLNIADDSILPRQGKLLPLKILFGFTSPHAHNKLKYAEKNGDNPKEDYRRKARYYLHVENGFGEVQREFVIEKKL